MWIVIQVNRSFFQMHCVSQFFAEEVFLFICTASATFSTVSGDESVDHKMTSVTDNIPSGSALINLFQCGCLIWNFTKDGHQYGAVKIRLWQFAFAKPDEGINILQTVLFPLPADASQHLIPVYRTRSLSPCGPTVSQRQCQAARPTAAPALAYRCQFQKSSNDAGAVDLR